MQNCCPICGGTSISLIDEKAKKYRCNACDGIFTVTPPTPKPAPKAPPAPAPTVVPKAATPAAPTVFTAKEVYKKTVSGVVEVAATFGNDESRGTGFCVSGNGFFVTNAHVVVGKQNNKLVLCDGVAVSGSRTNDFNEAEVVFLDADSDLALLRIKGRRTCRPLTFAMRDPETGDRVFAIGNSRGEGLSLLDGLVGDVNRPFRKTKAFLFNALVTHGCSGGPVFNERAEICGATVGGVENSAGMNYAIPISTIANFILRAKNEKGLAF